MATKRAPNYRLWAKMILTGGVVCIGGPALVWYVMPTDEELFQRYNPELQKKSLEGRYQRQKEYDDFVLQLKHYSKSDKNIWAVQRDEEKKAQQARLAEKRRLAQEAEARREEMRRDAGLMPQQKR